MNKKLRVMGFIAIMIVVSLACTITGGTAPTTPPDTGLVNTQVAMAMTLTAMANPIVPAGQQPAGPSNDPNLVSTQVAMAMTQTAMSNPPQVAATNTPEPTFTPEPTELDIASMIKNANILIYEDIIGYPAYLPYVSRALKSVDAHETYVGDAMGTFMDELNSGTEWDLIIMASEARGAISGEYWEVIKNKVDNGSALIAELWYINLINQGKISPLLYQCGVELQKDWWRTYGADRLAFDMYWVVSDSPVFNEPNKVTRFAASLTDPAWDGDIGDLMKLRSGSDATILASKYANDNQSTGGLITSCYDGRMILQTFDSHDYPTDPMVALWENYIIYTLTNHFMAEN